MHVGGPTGSREEGSIKIDDSYIVFNDFVFAKEGAQDGVGGVGRTSRAAKDAKTAIIESVTC